MDEQELKFTTVVGRREEGDQMALSEALESVHHAFVRPDDQLEVVVLAEFHNAVRLRQRELSEFLGSHQPKKKKKKKS